METTKIKRLPKKTSLKLQLNIGRIDYRYGRITLEELNKIENQYKKLG